MERKKRPEGDLLHDPLKESSKAAANGNSGRNKGHKNEAKKKKTPRASKECGKQQGAKKKEGKVRPYRRKRANWKEEKTKREGGFQGRRDRGPGGEDTSKNSVEKS